MDNKIIKEIAIELHISDKQVNNTLALLADGNTVPFIARYRKELTGNLDEEQIRVIEKQYQYQVKLATRKDEVKRLIEEKGMLSEALVNQIDSATILQEVEDIYLPYKEKRKTKATEAIKKGLEPLAQFILTLPSKTGIIKKEASKFLSDEVEDEQQAITEAGYIIAEQISENKDIREYVRNQLMNYSSLNTKLKKGADALDEKHKYEIYYDFTQLTKRLKPYQILAINRAEKEKIINVKFIVDEERILNYIQKKIIKKDSDATQYLNDFIKDAFDRLLYPSLSREARGLLSERADARAIEVFADNLENLLLQPPVSGKTVLGVDPAYRTGCKLAIIDPTGKLLEISKMFPTPPKADIDGSKKVLEQLLNKYPINQIVIGNGTASRETEKFVKQFIKDKKYQIPVAIVSEAGASVYSASKLAQNEFPDLQVEERSAVSIARRIQDPMAELVKIEPKSIGVGQYQHDVNQKELAENLDFVMIKNINKVGVNINTASPELLKYVSGLDKTIANNIVEYRNAHGKFTNRNQIKDVKRLGPKAFEQSAGFLKILDGDNKLDATFIHPESYEDAHKIIDGEHINLDALNDENYLESLRTKDINQLAEKYHLTQQFIADIIESLTSSHIDVREELEVAEFDPSITTIDEVKDGMKIKGQVRNIVDFGAFVDIGIKNDALVHISEISDNYVSDVSQVLNIGDIKEFKVKEIDLEKGRIQLTLKEK